MSSPTHPLDLFPDLVWREVLKNLSSVDHRSCNNTCHYFRELLKRTSMCWNLNKIFPLIVQNGENTGADNPTFRLSKTDILNCRLVCQAWRSSVDDYVERCHKCVEGPHYTPFFDDEDQLDRLINDMENFPLGQNKFLWNNVELGKIRDFEDPEELTEEEVEAYWEKGYVLLQSIGFQVTRILIDWIPEYSPAGGLALTKIVQRCLTLLPKLKELRITTQELEYWEDEISYGMDEIDEYLALNPLPPLPHLKSLAFWKILPVSLIENLMTTYGPQLESLQASDIYKIPCRCIFQRFGQLKILKISNFQVQDNLMNLNFLGYLNCPLEVLQLDIEDNLQELSVIKFLKKIQKLPIQEMYIRFRMSYDDPIPASLTLATMKSLSLDAGGRQNWPVSLSFDFLECFPNLESLKFTWKHDPTVSHLGDERRIQLNDILNTNGNLYESNIWDVLPKLEEIIYRKKTWVDREQIGWNQRRIYRESVIRKRVFTRQKYELVHRS